MITPRGQGEDGFFVRCCCSVVAAVGLTHEQSGVPPIATLRLASSSCYAPSAGGVRRCHLHVPLLRADALAPELGAQATRPLSSCRPLANAPRNSRGKQSGGGRGVERTGSSAVVFTRRYS